MFGFVGDIVIVGGYGGAGAVVGGVDIVGLLRRFGLNLFLRISRS